MWRAILPVLLAGACSSRPPLLIDQTENSSATVAGEQPPLTVDVVRRAVRVEANRVNATDCSTVTIPDDAIVPIEVTGGGDAEYAVFFGRARCDAKNAASWFSGTGGGLIQLWSASGDVPRLLFEHAMHGFTPTASGFVSLQHGSACPGGAGPGACLVTYDWTSTADGFQVRSRRLYDDRHPGVPPTLRYDWNYPLPG